MNDRVWLQATAQAMRDIGGGEPRLVLDLDRLQANVRQVCAGQAPDRSLRLVQKSLPSLALLRWLAPQLGTQRLMLFHRPYLNHYAKHWPTADLLLGKPMPVAAAAAFYADFEPGKGFDPSQQLHWLIDSDARLAQYQGLAQSLSTTLSLALEIDVGMHRGGFAEPAAMQAALRRIAADPAHLRLSAFMGYDAQAAKAPPWLGTARAVAQANARYRAFESAVRSSQPTLAQGIRFRNGAGSPTLLQHGADSPLDDLALGSALVKPTDFDVPSLARLQPAALIAAPVLKVADGMAIPFLERASALAARWLPGRRRSVFLYGGRWMAQPVWPQGLRCNQLYGLSSNQQLMNLAAEVPLQVDDVALFRPTQSEAVFTQFGTLWGLRAGRLEARFEPDPA